MTNQQNCQEQAAEGLRTSSHVLMNAVQIEKPAAGGTTAGSESRLTDLRNQSMLNDSTRAVIRKVDVLTDEKSIRNFISLITADGLPREFRTLGKNKKPKSLTATGGKQTDVIVNFLTEQQRTNRNCYVTVNPRKQRVSRLQVSDGDISHRTFIPVDVDPVRKSGTLATDEQREAAKSVCSKVVEWYRTNFPENLPPIIGCSGSGWQILIPCHMKASEVVDKLVDRLLSELSKKFSTEDAKIDTTVKNRSRIMRVCGTVAHYSDGKRAGWFESGPSVEDLQTGQGRLTEIALQSWFNEMPLLSNVKDRKKVTASKPTPKKQKAAGPILKPVSGKSGITMNRLNAYMQPILSDITNADEGFKHTTLYAKTAKIANLAAGLGITDAEGDAVKRKIVTALEANSGHVEDWESAQAAIDHAWNKGLTDPDYKLTEDNQSDEERHRVIIPLEYNNPASILNELTPHLANAGVYQRDGSLCRIVKDEGSKIKGIGRKAAGGPVVDFHDLHSITPVIGNKISFQRERITKDGEITTSAITPPAALMHQLLRLKTWPETPHLVGITRAPFMRPDGTICTDSGYDPETGWYLDYHGSPVVVPEKPTRATAEDAALTLLSLTDDFEFMDDSHRAAFLSYLLTLIARPGIEGHCPAHVFTANTPGAGKTLLVDIANLIAFGQVPPGYQAPQNAENADEWRKMLFSFSQTGALSLVVSNYPSGKAIGNAALDMVLTEHRIMDRVLGKSESRESAWIATVAITGNNLGSSADFVFRSIWSVLESSEENPRQRSGFKIADIRGHVLEHRHNLLRKALTILTWHAGEGFPAAQGQNYGSFEVWAKVVRDAVMHLTGHDVLKNNEVAGIADVEADELTTLLMGFKEYHNWKAGDVKISAADIYNDLTNPDYRTAFNDLRSLVDTERGKRSFESSFGKLVNRHKGRVKDIGKNSPERVKIVVNTYYRRKYIDLVTLQ